MQYIQSRTQKWRCFSAVVFKILLDATVVYFNLKALCGIDYSGVLIHLFPESLVRLSFFLMKELAT